MDCLYLEGLLCIFMLCVVQHIAIETNELYISEDFELWMQ